MQGRIAYRTSIVAAGARARTALAARGRSLLGSHQALLKERADREERSYRHYIEECSGDYRTFSQLSPREQWAYWSWRLTHETEL